MLTLNIPPRRDPLARFTLLASATIVLYALVTSATAPAAAQSDPDPVIIIATPTLPTPALAEVPALALPTPIPSDPFAGHALPAPAGIEAPAPLANIAPQPSADYIANVGAQAPHSPRGDNPPAPPSYSTGPIEVSPAIAIDPNGQQSVPAPIAVAVPHISDEAAAVIGARASNGCAPGQVFFPRTGCHTPGSGGPQPGAVGEAQP